jgi:diazepam-binding inhibitor (GABA receptor modulator, acyl-CoA-binding protein)
MSAPDPDLEAQFESAVARSKSLSERPDNATLLQMYALYKQATEGDVTEPRPGAMDFVAAAKWNARDALRGLDRAEAMRRYIQLVEGLAA